MNPNDLSFVVGILLLGLSLPWLLNGWTHDRLPPFGTLLGLGGIALIGLGMSRHPGGYGVTDIIPAFERVITGLTN